MRQAGAQSTKFKEVLTFRVLQVLTLHLHGPENGASLNIASPCLAFFTAAPRCPPAYLSALDASPGTPGARDLRLALRRESLEGRVCVV